MTAAGRLGIRGGHAGRQSQPCPEGKSPDSPSPPISLPIPIRSLHPPKASIPLRHHPTHVSQIHGLDSHSPNPACRPIRALCSLEGLSALRTWVPTPAAPKFSGKSGGALPGPALETRGASRAGGCGHQDGGVWSALTPEPSPAPSPFSGWLVVTLLVSEPQQVLMRETERLRSCTCLRLDFRTRGHTHTYRKEPGNT